MRKNNKKLLTPIEFEALYERSMINAKYMKNKQETIDINKIWF